MLEADAIRYREWPPDNTAHLRNAAGVYHFFRIDNEAKTSLYVGKATVSTAGWSLYKRMAQHFQPSQRNALAGLLARYQEITGLEAVESLRKENVFVQWLCIPEDEGQSAVVSFENFAKSVLQPKYTKE